MIKRSAGFIAALGFTIILFQNCTKETTVNTTSGPSLQLPGLAYNYNVSLPQHIAQALPAQDNTPADNPITNDGATLGRVLFYDKTLSKNLTISCASCHKQELGFSDNAILSFGFNGGKTRRHSMSLLNARFYRSGKMFWDERAGSLEEQVLMPIQDPTEMGMTLPELVARVSTASYYPALFEKAFGSNEVTAQRISKALSQFVRSLTTYQSKYDQVKQGHSVFTADEAQGEQLFLTAGPGACGGCHRPPMFITSNPAGPFALADPADGGINNENRFKSGSLRNIFNTAPFFHNGSVPTVEAMLASNIRAHGIPPQDRDRILAFLRTLTDNTILTDVKFSNPFRN